MATDLAQNQALQRFIELLAALNHQSVEMIKTGNMEILPAMNDTIEEMYALQYGKTEEVYTAIEEEMQVVYKNFNAIVTMLQSTEEADEKTSNAVKKFLHNIFEASVRIIYAYGLAE